MSENDKQVEPVDPTPIGPIGEKTPFERLGPTSSWPSWWLTHILGDTDVQGVRWSNLTDEQKGMVQNEAKMRQAASDKSKALLTEGKEGEAEGDAEGEEAPDPKFVAKLSGLTIPQVEDLVHKAKTAAQLDEIEDAENAGKMRSGVYDAVAKRRAELQP